MDRVRLSDLYASITQTASILHVNRAIVRRWIKEGKLKGEKIGQTTLIPKEDVLTLIQQHMYMTFGAKK
jgi:excisionase family DNA binding protein